MYLLKPLMFVYLETNLKARPDNHKPNHKSKVPSNFRRIEKCSLSNIKSIETQTNFVILYQPRAFTKEHHWKAKMNLT